MKRLLRWGIVVVAMIAVAIGGYFYYQHGRYYPSTNDAYVKANVIEVSPEVAGRVRSVEVSDQDSVHKGQLLVRIDPTTYRAKVREAEANVALAKQTVTADQAAVKAARASVADRKARLRQARTHYHRIKRLVSQDVKPKSALTDARATLDSARASLHLAEAKLNQAQKELGPTGTRNERVKKAQAQLDQAQKHLADTRVTAPCDGRVSGVKLQRGDVVQSGASQFALVCQNRYWVYANFKETDLTRIRPGQTADIAVDMYPNHTFHGIVQNVNPASGTAFSLLPPENATGNWVKVPQRVPVRVLVVDTSKDFPLRVQTSTEVTIETGTKKKPAGRARGHGLSNSQALALARRKGLEQPAMAEAGP